MAHGVGSIPRVGQLAAASAEEAPWPASGFILRPRVRTALPRLQP